MTNKEIYDLTKYLFEAWERGADYDNYHMDSQYVLDALVMPEKERWLLYKSPAQREAYQKGHNDGVAHHKQAVKAAQPEQEPVAWMCCAFDGKVCEQSNHDECENPIPLYTIPPKEENT